MLSEENQEQQREYDSGQCEFPAAALEIEFAVRDHQRAGDGDGDERQPEDIAVIDPPVGVAFVELHRLADDGRFPEGRDFAFPGFHVDFDIVVFKRYIEGAFLDILAAHLIVYAQLFSQILGELIVDFGFVRRRDLDGFGFDGVLFGMPHFAVVHQNSREGERNDEPDVKVAEVTMKVSDFGLFHIRKDSSVRRNNSLAQ